MLVRLKGVNVLDETPRYRKKKRQVSKSEKRSDHKHLYEESILITYNSVDRKTVNLIAWCDHCSVCGRSAGIKLYNTDKDEVFKKPEYRGRHLFWSHEQYRPVDEILAEFPNVPVYTNDFNDVFKHIRIR